MNVFSLFYGSVQVPVFAFTNKAGKKNSQPEKKSIFSIYYAQCMAYIAVSNMKMCGI